MRCVCVCVCPVWLQVLRIPQKSPATVSGSVRSWKLLPTRRPPPPIWTSTSLCLERKDRPAWLRCVPHPPSAGSCWHTPLLRVPQRCVVCRCTRTGRASRWTTRWRSTASSPSVQPSALWPTRSKNQWNLSRWWFQPGNWGSVSLRKNCSLRASLLTQEQRRKEIWTDVLSQKSCKHNCLWWVRRDSAGDVKSQHFTRKWTFYQNQQSCWDLTKQM